MLETRKRINIEGESKVTVTDEEGNTEEIVVTYMTAILPIGSSNGEQSSINQNVANMSLYEANKEECRKDFDDFTAYVRSIEDKN